MIARWRTAWIGHGGAHDLQRRIIQIDFPARVIVRQAQDSIGSRQERRLARRDRSAAAEWILGRFLRGVVERKHRLLWLEEPDPFQELVAPEFAWRHVHQLLDVD